MINKPLLICMTPVRNEAWVLQAFLKATSLWADYIILADQQSTDRSKEIAMCYPKVILIENSCPEFNESERQKMLIGRARQIVGDKILIGLDADEIFSANYIDTEDWKKIKRSKPGDVFCFRWANICMNQKEYWSPETYFPWMFHDDGKEPHGNYVRNIHSMRIPFPIEEKQMFYVTDFKVMHLSYLNNFRNESKNRFYKFVDWEMNHRSTISLSRVYMQLTLNDLILVLDFNYVYKKPLYDFNLFDNVEIDTNKFWFDDYVKERINRYPIENIRKLDIWNKEFLSEYKMIDPRTFNNKIIHFYLRTSSGISKTFFIRLIDKILIKIGC